MCGGGGGHQRNLAISVLDTSTGLGQGWPGFPVPTSALPTKSVWANYCGQESLRGNGVALIVNKRVQNAVLGYNLKNDRMISVCFQGKPFNITVIQIYAPRSNEERAEVEWFYED